MSNFPPVIASRGPQGPKGDTGAAGPAGPAGASGPFILFAHHDADLPDTGAGASNKISVNFTSPAGGLALIMLSAMIQSDSGSGMRPEVFIDNTGSDIVPSHSGGLPYFPGGNSGDGSHAETSSLIFTATLPSGTHTLDFYLLGVFGSSYYHLHAFISVFYQ